MTTTMRAVGVTPSTKQVGIVAHPAPQIESATHVKLRMLDIGVCGTDKEICAFEYGTPPAGSEHLVIGHESLGEVVEAGDKVKGFKPGDLVVPMVRRPCPHERCRPCQSGRQDFCTTGDFVERGIKEMHGFMTEYVVDEERYMNLVPATLRDVAVLVEPLTIAEKSLIQLWGIQERLPWECLHAHSDGRGHCHTAVAIGAGPVGLLGAMALVVSGFETWVYSREDEDSPKAKLVLSFGAKYSTGAVDPPAKLAEKMGGIDVVYEAAGSSRIVFDLLPHLGPNGVFVLTGVPGLHEPKPVDSDRIMRQMVLRNQIVLGTVNAGRDAFEAAIRHLTTFAQTWPEAVRALITGRFPVDAHRELLLGSPTGIKHVISFEARG